jgi:aryl sulfotransferase
MSKVVWLASYPKSGNTWLRLLLASCLNGGRPVDINAIPVGSGLAFDRAAFDERLGVAAADLAIDDVLALKADALRAEVADIEPPLFLKTHDARLHLPGGEWTVPPDITRGAVYLIRDPRDIAPSLARHLGYELDRTIDFMARPARMAQTRRALPPQLPQVWSDWSGNVESWLTAAPFPAFVVRYEKLRAAPEETLVDILGALDLPQPRQVVRDAVAATALDKLRAQEAAEGFSEAHLSTPFFGAGRVGGWKKLLTPVQASRIEADHGVTMRRLGYLA